MIEKFKENTKIKIIALLSALVLWMYVMAVVDPEETRVFENIPVSITNMDELISKNFMIYPEMNMVTDIYVTGKLSNIQNVTKEDITVYTTVKDPKQGNNAVYLKATIGKGVTHLFKQDIMIIPLEKVVDEKRSVDVVVEGKYKTNLDTLDLEYDSVKISGPEILVNQVQKLKAVLKLDEMKDVIYTTLNLVPVNEQGEEVKGISLETSSINVVASLLIEKNVPINIVFADNNENLQKYELSQNEIVIKGKKDIIDKITSINTKPIDLSAIKEGEDNEVQLEIPEGIKVDKLSKVTIKIETIKELTNKFVYSSNDIEIRNNDNSIEVSKLNIPSSIDVNVEYPSSIDNLDKSDIKLYIDLSDSSDVYKIKHESKYEFTKITINPTEVKVLE
ncbi:MAG: CdaR family protein [Peptostreptococcaceae bacterium]